MQRNTLMHDLSGLEAHRHIDRSGLKQYGYRNRSGLKKQTAWAQKQTRAEETNSMGIETDLG